MIYILLSLKKVEKDNLFLQRKSRYCYNSGEELIRLNRIYRYDPNCELRTQVKYEDDVYYAPQNGIKGASDIFELVSEPHLDRIIIDPMHATFLGWAK